MIQRYFEAKPACDMLQDSGSWGPDTMSLSRSDKTLLGQIECYLTPITKQLFSLEGEHYVTLSTVMPKVSYLLNKALEPVPSDAVCTNVARWFSRNMFSTVMWNCTWIQATWMPFSHGLLFAATYLDPRFKSFDKQS